MEKISAAIIYALYNTQYGQMNAVVLYETVKCAFPELTEKGFRRAVRKIGVRNLHEDSFLCYTYINLPPIFLDTDCLTDIEKSKIEECLFKQNLIFKTKN